MGKYLALISILCVMIVISIAHSVSRLCCLLLKGAIGKCTSLFVFFGSVMNGCVASSPTNANNVQP